MESDNVDGPASSAAQLEVAHLPQLMPLPVWIVAIRDPAYAYMLRSSGVRRPRTRLRRRRAGPIFTGYAPIGALPPQPTNDEMRLLRAQAAENNRLALARVREVEQRHAQLLAETAAELMRAGTATLRTSSGDIRARLIPFRHEAVVLEIHYPGGRIQARSTQSSLLQQAFHQLADALASAHPEAEPLA